MTPGASEGDGEPGGDERAGPPQPGGLSVRWPELAVSGLLATIALLVIADSLRVGTGWADDGPRPGYFPFYVGLLLLAASGFIFLSQLLRWRRDARVRFADREQALLVWAMLWPIAAYIAAIFVLGIYVASALLIAYFMRRHGRYGLAATLAVASAVPLLLFLVFERWFLVPLPKGPLERLLGF